MKLANEQEVLFNFVEPKDKKFHYECHTPVSRLAADSVFGR